MSKKLITIFIISHLVVISVGVYGGMKYGQSKTVVGSGQAANFQNFRNFTPEQRQQSLRQMSAGNDSGGVRLRQGSGGQGFVAGEIISKDSQSITVKLQDGGSKIVFYSDSTEIGKFTDGVANDLEAGKSVTVNGQANSDGSITAQLIQLRPGISRQ